VDPILRGRLLAGAGVLAVFAIGASQAGGAVADVEQRVAAIRADERTADEAQAAAMEREHRFKSTSDYFASALADDQRRYALTAMDLDTLRQPNPFEHLVEQPVVIPAGGSATFGPIRVEAKLEKVDYSRQGATITARHAVAHVTNAGDRPLAYLLRVRSADRGACDVRGSIAHNAMSLLAGETARVAVCAGTGGIEILDLRILGVTPIGHVYVSKLPAQAVGHDAVTARSHTTAHGIETCSRVPAGKLANLIEAGTVQWEDVVDFYSRHNCDRTQYADGYRRATQALDVLPWTGG
jgi:hypothetical protein